MHQRTADRLALAVQPPAVLGGSQQISVSVLDIPHFYGGAFRVNMSVIGLHSPLVPMEKQIHHQITRSAQKSEQEKIEHNGAKSHGFHE